jgi:hypothetical protein
MNYETFKTLRAPLVERVETTGAKLNTYPAGPMGLTPDSVKATPEWRDDRAAFNGAANTLRAFDNAFKREFHKTWPVYFKKDIAAEATLRSRARLAALEASRAATA